MDEDYGSYGDEVDEMDGYGEEDPESSLYWDSDIPELDGDKICVECGERIPMVLMYPEDDRLMSHNDFAVVCKCCEEYAIH